MDNHFPTLLPGAEPLFYRGSTIGCLLLHGLTAAPYEVAWMGQHLAAQGLTVCVPRLAGHGADFRLLQRTRWQDWYLSALDGYHLLKTQCDTIFVAGLSTGGLLTLALSAHVAVDGLIVMAAPVSIPQSERTLALARWLKFARPFIDLPDTTDFPQRLRAEQARRGEPERGRVRYDRWATRALQEFHALMSAAEISLPKITAPALLIYSEADQTVPFFNQERVANQLGSKIIEKHTLKNSGHILTQDMERETVFDLAADFIQRTAKA